MRLPQPGHFGPDLPAALARIAQIARTSATFHPPPGQIEIIDIPTEQTTAATDAILAVLATGCGLALLRERQRNPWRVGIWSATLGTLALAGALGAVAHGFKMPEPTNALLWRPLNLALGATIALFVTGVIYDLWGRRAATYALPVMLTSAGGFVLVTLVRPGTFLVFVAYQSVGMFFALATYTGLALRRYSDGRSLQGTGWMAAGVLTTIVASAIQALGRVSFTLIWPFDHNGTYHLVQMAGIGLLFVGVRSRLLEEGASAQERGAEAGEAETREA